MIEFNNQDHGRILADEIGIQYNPEHDTVIARVTSQGNLLGGVIFNNYTGTSITIHVAGFSPTWINPDMLWVTFHYPFVRLGCRKIIGQVSSGNSRALEFDKKLGFIEEARIKDVYPDGDLVLVSMTREDCRWLRIKPRSLKDAA